MLVRALSRQVGANVCVPQGRATARDAGTSLRDGERGPEHPGEPLGPGGKGDAWSYLSAPSLHPLNGTGIVQQFSKMLIRMIQIPGTY